MNILRTEQNFSFLKFLQNSQKNTCARVSFLIKLLAEKSLKIHKKTPMLETRFLLSQRLKKCAKFARKHLCRSLVFNKTVGWKHKINISLLIHLHFFIIQLITKSKVFVPFTQCALLITGKFDNCLHSAIIIPNIGSCGDGL